MPLCDANGISPRSTPRRASEYSAESISIAKNGRRAPTSIFEIIILLIRRDGVEGSLLRSCPAGEIVRPCTALRFSGGIRGVDSPLGVSFVCLPATAHLCKWA